MFPFTSIELQSQFKLEESLHWGTLPKIYELSDIKDKEEYLRSYSITYLKEEIVAEQAVRNLEPFREFLEVAAQHSGKIINFSEIAKDVGVQTKTVQNYFEILCDTHMGFFLPAFHRSIRKSQKESPKFYFFDNGVKKALERSLESKPSPSTSAFGDLFEAFIIQEVFRLNSYFNLDWRMSFFRTKNNSEVDLILTKGRETILIEVKSYENKNSKDIDRLNRLAPDFKARAYFVSRDELEEKSDKTTCLHWQSFLKLLIEKKL
jgi:predicted AAA+ superfamily ATPase